MMLQLKTFVFITVKTVFKNRKYKKWGVALSNTPFSVFERSALNATAPFCMHKKVIYWGSVYILLLFITVNCIFLGEQLKVLLKQREK